MKQLYLEKGMRIMSDLVTFCHNRGGKKFEISFSHQDGTTTLTICSPINHLDNELLESLRSELSIPRQPEIEQNYWELSGECEMSEQLTLVGMMIDQAEVNYRNGVLHIQIQRYE